MKKEQGKMKTLRYILLSVAVASLASACSDDLNPDGPANKAEKGDEVRFTMALPGADTRTIYGDETKTGFPVYWVNGDKVRVACLWAFSCCLMRFVGEAVCFHLHTFYI